MTSTIVSSWNEFDPLRHIIVGRAENTCLPPLEPATEIKTKDSDMWGMYGPRSPESVIAASEELDNFVNMLTSRNIRVDRANPIQWNRAIQTPDFSVDTMFGCMPPRDVLLTVGSEILSAPMSFRCRFFEYIAYHSLMLKYFDEDPNFKWEQAPRPRLSEDTYKAGYYDNYNLEEQILRTKNKDYVTTEHEPLFDAADVLRLGKDLFCQHSFTTNVKGMRWLQRHFPDHRVHCINFPGGALPTHIDATFVPLRPGLIINNPERPLPPEQKKIFTANDWEIIDAAKPAHSDPPPLCYSSVWLSMNILMLDRKTVVVEGSEVHQMEQLDSLGFEVLPMPFRNVYPFGGGLHCSTGDVLREGSCEDYFPNQLPGTQIEHHIS